MKVERRSFIKGLLGLPLLALLPTAKAVGVATHLRSASMTVSPDIASEHTTYALGYRVSHELIEGDPAHVKKIQQDLAFAAKAHLDRLAHSLFNQSFTPDYSNWPGPYPKLFNGNGYTKKCVSE